MPPIEQEKNPYSSTIKVKAHGSDDHSSKRGAIVFFRIGALRFGVHGVVGIISVIQVSYALFSSYMGHAIPAWLALSAVSSCIINSVGSYELLNQVPITSKIASWIFPPHREAFKRTIAITGYLNIRLLHEWQWFLGRESILFPLILFMYTNYHFFPFNSDYSNGNTWVFVLPMFLGFNIDTFKQFPVMDFKALSVESLKSSLTNARWHHVHAWNTERVDETYLLLTLLCALQIAFMFTVAFRGRMSIQRCYWIAAAEVSALCIRLVH